MSMPMMRVRQVPSPNYSPVAIRHDLIVLHMCEGSYAGSVAWLCDARSNASAHLCMKADGSEVTQLVPLSQKAWAQKAFNSAGVSVEIEGFTAQGMSDQTMLAAARIAAWLCRAYAIPPVWAQGGQGRGVCCHHDLGAAGGGHVDICGVGDATWVKMMALIQAAYADFAAGPLPAFALHGLPNPALAELPPIALPEPSHGGAARNEDGDKIPHATSSGFPHGSVADLQWRLNKAGALPALVVDGFAGVLTRTAIRKFQHDHQLDVDGLAGAMTWAALDKATAA